MQLTVYKIWQQSIHVCGNGAQKTTSLGPKAVLTAHVMGEKDC